MSYTPDHQNHTADPSFRERIAQGTEDLTEEARTRVIAARERAIAAGREMNRQAHHAQDRSIDLFERQPLIVGAIAFAIGAAIGAALPRTRLEDSTFGATRDDLVAEAERIYEEEKIRARAAIKEAGSEAQQAVKDAAGAAQDELKDHVPDKKDGKAKAADEVDHVRKKAAQH